VSFSIGELRRWDTCGVATAGSSVASREFTAEDARRILSDGREALADGWEGVAADAVLDAAEAEKTHVTKLADGLHDLADTLGRAAAALAPAVEAVRNRVAEAEAAGLVVGATAPVPPPGRTDIGQATVDEHAAAIQSALDTVASLDEHYGREIDAVASMLHAAIPPEVDRSPIPGPDDPWPGRAADAATGGFKESVEREARDLDPDRRGRHARISIPDDQARAVASDLGRFGRFAGGVGTVTTVVGGVNEYASGESSAGRAAAGVAGALGGGAAGGAMAGAAAGSIFGPVGTFIGAGIGAAIGSELGHDLVQAGFDALDDKSGDEGPDGDER
jgi:uncharacterized protein YukE